MTRLAVLGSPIAHSQSPALHRAAYGVLDLDWEYEAFEVDTARLAPFLASCSSDWRGMSLTMPLKADVLPLLDAVHPFASLTGAANTVLFDWGDDGRRTLRGFNTDVFGIVTAFRNAGVDALTTVRILGSGATAASALVAVAGLGVGRAEVSARTAHRLDALIRIGEAIGVEVSAHGFADGIAPSAVISTLPGGANHSFSFDETTRSSSVLLDVSYDPWPSALASRWFEAGGQVIPGIEMLVNQALMQVRIFVGGDPERVLPAESEVLVAMRASVGR